MYLGLPTFCTRQKRIQFDYLRERVRKKLMAWNHKDFSARGREVLLKAVIQAIPTYAMQCFKIPDSVCESISRMCAAFWWGDKEEKRSMHWVKWEVVCRPKARGGVGFRDIKAFNRALLAKQLWRMITQPNSFVAQVFRAKYCKDGDFLRAEPRAGCSYIWRSILGCKAVIEEGASWSVGNGNDIGIFSDKWVRYLHGRKVKGRGDREEAEMRVAHFLKETGEWNEDRLEEMFEQHEAEAIRKTPVGEHGQRDMLRWEHEPKGTFSVKTAYLQIMGFFKPLENMSSDDKKFWIHQIWNTNIPPKAKIMIWKACNHFLAANGNLRAHHVPVDGICALCHDRWGSTEHTLFFCPRVKEGWKSSRFWRLLKKADMLDFVSISTMIQKEFQEEEYEVWCFMVWQTWIQVCKWIHGESGEGDGVIEANCWARWEVYQAARQTTRGSDELGVLCGEKRWRKSKRGIFRVDVDAAFKPDENKYGVRIIIWDSKGRVAVAAGRKTPARSNVMIAEAMAVVSGIILSMEHGIMPIEIYTDSILVARLMADEDEEKKFLPDDIADILGVARENCLLDVKHMYRTANRAAHSLATFACELSSDVTWTITFPKWLRVIVDEEEIDE